MSACLLIAITFPSDLSIKIDPTKEEMYSNLEIDALLVHEGEHCVRK